MQYYFSLLSFCNNTAGSRKNAKLLFYEIDAIFFVLQKECCFIFIIKPMQFFFCLVTERRHIFIGGGGYRTASVSFLVTERMQFYFCLQKLRNIIFVYRKDAILYILFSLQFRCKFILVKEKTQY